MTDTQIMYFLKTAELMSFSAAAQALYVTQPSVSRQIKLLESELGYTLFDRTRKNALRLTAAGVVFQDAFSRTYQLYQTAQDTARALSGHNALSLCVGIGAGWDLSCELTAARQALIQSYPQAEVTFESHEFRELRRRVRSGELDSAVCTKTSIPDFEGLEIIQLCNLESRAYVKRGLLRPEGEPLQASDFSGQNLLMLTAEESPMAMELALLQFQARQVKVTPRYLPNRDSILQALLLGEGVAVFDQYMHFSGDPRLSWLDLEDDIPICLLWSKGNQHPLIRLFADALAAEMAGR